MCEQNPGSRPEQIRSIHDQLGTRDSEKATIELAAERSPERLENALLFDYGDRIILG